MKRLFRGVTIVWVALRFGLDQLVLTSFQRPWLHLLARILSVGRNLDAPRGQRMREAMEHLGPIFVKLGQVLSTRRDLLPPDIADELALLQDRVPPFDSAIAIDTIERAFHRPVGEVFVAFDPKPVASASKESPECSPGAARTGWWRSRSSDGGYGAWSGSCAPLVTAHRR